MNREIREAENQYMSKCSVRSQKTFSQQGSNVSLVNPPTEKADYSINSSGTKNSLAPKPHYSVNSELPQKQLPYTEFDEFLQTCDFVTESPLLMLKTVQTEVAAETDQEHTGVPYKRPSILNLHQFTPFYQREKDPDFVSFVRNEAPLPKSMSSFSHITLFDPNTMTPYSHNFDKSVKAQREEENFRPQTGLTRDATTKQLLRTPYFPKKDFSQATNTLTLEKSGSLNSLAGGMGVVSMRNNYNADFFDGGTYASVVT